MTELEELEERLKKVEDSLERLKEDWQAYDKIKMMLNLEKEK